MFEAKVLADSTPPTGIRLITMEITFPRFVLAEFNTHKMISKNSASSRAIPVEKMIKRVQDNPVIPIHWGAAQKGMQAYDVLGPEDQAVCEMDWLLHRDEAVSRVRSMLHHGLHKQIANRLLEPWMWTTVICTGNIGAFNNFWSLRCHPEAEPHIRRIAEMSESAAKDSTSQMLEVGEWHLPLTGFPGDEALSKEDLVKVSAGRCARVSYFTHDGVRNVQADIDLHDRLVESKHFSPTEHQAKCVKPIHYAIEWDYLSDRSGGNLGTGWSQYRKTLQGEYQKENR